MSQRLLLRAQRGVSLLFALLALAAISLAAVALVRSVDSGTQVIGNLGFKQDATAAADRATEVARAWLMAPGRDLTVDSTAGVGYYASAQDNLDPTGRLTTSGNPLPVVNWGDADSCACLSTTPATCSSCSRRPSDEISLNGGAVRARYIITRLCPLPGAVNFGNACAQPPSNAISNCINKSEIRIGRELCPTQTVEVPYYRIIVRTVSGRNTVSFTETMVY